MEDALKSALREMVTQNRATCNYSFKEINSQNRHWRLNDDTASIGFIYRHIGEIMNLMGFFFGINVEVKNTTMGEKDSGKDYDMEESRDLIEKGYSMLNSLIDDIPEEDWFQTVDTPFFGSISRVRLFAHVLNHNSYHSGQITLTLKRGN